MDPRRITQGHLSAFLTIFIWGTTFLSTKILLRAFSPVEILFFRLIIATLVLLLVSPHFRKMTSLREELMYMGAGLCGVTLYFLFQNTALAYTLASNAGVLSSVAPFFTAIASYIFLKDEPLGRNFFLGFAVSILGIALIGFNGNVILKLNPLGDILSILSGVVWGVYSVLMKKISARQYEAIPGTRKVFVYGLLFLIPALWLSHFRLDLARFTYLPNLLHILYLGIAASALGYVTWNYAVSVLGAVKTSVYIYLIPVITVAASALLLHERITSMAMLGVILILAGLYLSERKTRSKAPLPVEQKSKQGR